MGGNISLTLQCQILSQAHATAATKSPIPLIHLRKLELVVRKPSVGIPLFCTLEDVFLPVQTPSKSTDTHAPGYSVVSSNPRRLVLGRQARVRGWSSVAQTERLFYDSIEVWEPVEYLGRWGYPAICAEELWTCLGNARLKLFADTALSFIVPRDLPKDISQADS